MARPYQVLLEWDVEEQAWVTYVPTLDYLSTYGDTREEALDHTHEAILGYLEASGLDVPIVTLQPEVITQDQLPWPDRPDV